MEAISIGVEAMTTSNKKLLGAPGLLLQHPWHLLLLAWHLFLLANIVPSSKARVTSSDALVPKVDPRGPSQWPQRREMAGPAPREGCL